MSALLNKDSRFYTNPALQEQTFALRLQNRCHHFHMSATTCAASHVFAGFYCIGLLSWLLSSVT